MKDFLSKATSRLDYEPFSNSNKNKEQTDKESVVWNTQKIDNLFEKINKGELDVQSIKGSPFKDNDVEIKKPNLPFELTPEEYEEWKKCIKDINYFATNYVYLNTDDGLTKIDELRDYQYEILDSFTANKFNILMASRQIGKTVTIGIFLAHYIISNFDKNVLFVADNQDTTQEIILKYDSIIRNLPFFLKPGTIEDNKLSKGYDNGCRVIGRTTTHKSGIGLTIDVLFIDEFAHIEGTYLDEFYHNIYPTIEARKNAKLIISSTPNGLNKFHEIWKNALNGKNRYKPLRVDWWQVPGRDERWKIDTINNLGSEEAFNQNYALQFFSSDKLLLDQSELLKINNLSSHYVSKKLKPIIRRYRNTENENDARKLSVHSKYQSYYTDDFKQMKDQIVLSIDTADGVQKDYSAINIFKMVPLPISILKKYKENIRDITDIFGFVQIGLYRSNTVPIEMFMHMAEILGYEVFNPKNVKFVIEMNHKGDQIYRYLSKNKDFNADQVISSKHKKGAKFYKPGILLKGDNKVKYCYDFKYYLSINRILPNEHTTVHELAGFGRNSKNQKIFRGQLGNDDLAMTCINLSSIFESPQYNEMAYYMMDIYNDQKYYEKVYKEILETGSESKVNYENASMLRTINNDANDTYNTEDILTKYLKQ